MFIQPMIFSIGICQDAHLPTEDDSRSTNLYYRVCADILLKDSAIE